MAPPPWASGGRGPEAPARLFSSATAERLRRALRETVRRGTASAAVTAAAATDPAMSWSLAGKTGTTQTGTTQTDTSQGETTQTGARQLSAGGLDGWFAGLVEDEGGRAEHVVVVWLEGAGPGGGRPARLAYGLARDLAR